MSPSSDRQDEMTRDEGGRPAGPAAAGDPPSPATAQETVPPTTSPTGEASGQDDGSREVEADFEKLLADAERQKEEYLELARRTKADFENFRKRAAADVQAATARGKAQLAPGLIDAVDNLERAFESIGLDPQADPLDSTSEATPDDFQRGVLMVLNGMRETLRSTGLEPVDPKGEKFDPTRHEALSTQPVEGTESGVVVEVIQKGYALGDQLVRPARVVVSA